ncbi:MAG: FixH family protein [Polyangiaceae bacterium]
MATPTSGAFQRPSRLKRFTRSLRWAGPLTASALLLAACSSDSDGNDGSGGTGNTEFSCKDATDTFSAGLSKMTTTGMFEVMLMDADPAPPAKLANTWMVHIKDANGDNVSGATLTVNPNMPAHGHGSSKAVAVTDMGDGMYQLDPVYMQMAGHWAVPISVTMGADTDSAQFDFCIAP